MQVRQNLYEALLKPDKTVITTAFNPGRAVTIQGRCLTVIQRFVTGLQQQQQLLRVLNLRAAQGLKLIQMGRFHGDGFTRVKVFVVTDVVTEQLVRAHCRIDQYRRYFIFFRQVGGVKAPQ